MKIIILKQAMKFISQQPGKQRERLLHAIHRLPEGDVKPTKGAEGLFRLRVGDYRVLFQTDTLLEIILVEKIGNRGDVDKHM